MDRKTYNGWTNYATWRINLEIFDGSQASDYGRYGRDDAADLASVLQDSAMEAVSYGSKGLALDYALAFMSDVNWREIADHMLEDVEEDALEGEDA